MGAVGTVGLRERRVARTRDAILRAALELFEQRGFSATTVDEIAARGDLRPDLDPRLAQLLTLGALNWAAEWWDPQRTSLEAMVTNAQSLIRSALTAAEPAASDL